MIGDDLVLTSNLGLIQDELSLVYGFRNRGVTAVVPALAALPGSLVES